MYRYSMRLVLLIKLLIHAELENVLQVCSGSGFIPAPLIDGGPTSQLVQVTFTPRYQ